MSNHEQTWETYTAAWKATTAEEKQALFRKSLNTECVYTDPLTQARGWDELLRYMLEFHQQVPGGHFNTTEFMTHHNRSIAKWEMKNANGTVIGDGVSYGEYDDGGRLLVMTGFFDTPAH